MAFIRNVTYKLGIHISKLFPSFICFFFPKKAQVFYKLNDQCKVYRESAASCTNATAETAQTLPCVCLYILVFMFMNFEIKRDIVKIKNKYKIMFGDKTKTPT